MPALFSALLAFFTPVVVFFISVAIIVSFLLGALADPQGLLNQIVCGLLDGIAYLLPSTPENLKIGNFLNSIGDSMPLVGRGLVKEVFATASAIFAIRMIIVIYKLLPFKFS